MLNNPFLGTYFVRRKWTMQSTDDELYCIRYSLHMPALAAVYVIALTRSTIALEITGTLFHCTLVDVLFRMYFEN